MNEYIKLLELREKQLFDLTETEKKLNSYDSGEIYYCFINSYGNVTRYEYKNTFLLKEKLITLKGGDNGLMTIYTTDKNMNEFKNQSAIKEIIIMDNLEITTLIEAYKIKKKK